MSLSRSPSPSRGGGWSSPGLTTPYEGNSGRSSPAIRSYPNGSAGNVTWASAQKRSVEVQSFQTRNQGFFSKHFRRISHSLPGNYAHKDKAGGQRWRPNSDSRARQFLSRAGKLAWKLRARLAVLAIFLFAVLIYYVTPLHRTVRRNVYGGSKFVVILAANEGGGVMEWKGPREWAIERDSVRNKKNYARKWGYELEIVDMATKKRYAHEWRESWEKVDTIRTTMRKYPNAEWFWWLDLNTFIMEPSYSLQSHIFNDLAKNTYRDINHYNPLNISHPPTDEFLDPESLSPVGDGKPSSINFILSQDCGGFNLGSFFVKRSVWTDRLLDIWWDPVGYEQKHMEWEHKEQDALEYMYTNQPWVRSHMSFIDQRKVNSFPPGACHDKGDDPNIHYVEKDRDFLVNMAGCQWGRDCWGEMYSYRQLSNRLNRNPWEKFKDGISDGFNAVFKSKKKDTKSS